MEIKTYWNERAATDAKNATTNDIHLRVLERNTLIAQLQRLGCHAGSNVVDLGCGDGKTVLAIAKTIGCKTHGMDYSASMIDLANEELAASGQAGVSFSVGDIREIGSMHAPNSFDFVLTDRVLINLDKTEEQYAVMGEIARIVRPGGHYLGIENFVDGNDRLNVLRASFGLPPIEIRWHNRFFDRAGFEAEAAKHFATMERIDFSSAYYLATRVIYSKLCEVENLKIDYAHPIHELSARLPPIGDCSPIVLYILGK